MEHPLLPMISVIIPTYHRNDLLEKCLNCLKPGIQSLAGDKYEIIISDDGKDNNAKEMIRKRFPWAKWVEGRHIGPAANRNNGAEHAQGEWLVFLDDDCLPDLDLLLTYYNAINENQFVKVFEGRIYANRPRKRLNEESPLNETGGYLWSCNFAINNNIFQKLGGFDERFHFAAMEDVDLHYRIKKNNLSIIFLNTASVCHPWRVVNHSLKRKINKVKSRELYLSIHPEERKRLTKINTLKWCYNKFRRNIIPYSFKFKFRGLWSELLDIIYTISFLLVPTKLLK